MADPVGNPEAATREPVLVSACLVGRVCRYDGTHNADELLKQRLEEEGVEVVPFCPEEHGGLGTPRPPAWIEAEGGAAVLSGRSRVTTEAGRDVTGEFRAGAEGAAELCRRREIRRAFLKECSPSCGVAQTHVAGNRCDGPGVTTARLRLDGVAVEGVEGRRPGS